MGEVLGGVLAIGALSSLVVFPFFGRDGVRRMFGGLLSGRNERWAGGLPANLLLIITAVILALEFGVGSEGAGSGLAQALIIGGHPDRAGAEHRSLRAGDSRPVVGGAEDG
jgi:hypothetical protein